MKTIMAGLCCLMMVASPLALSQNPGTQKKPPVTQKEAADKKKAAQVKMADCSKGAKGKGLQPGNAAFNRHMTDCLK